MKNKLQELEIRKRHLNQNIQTISKHFLNSYEEDFLFDLLMNLQKWKEILFQFSKLKLF